MINLVEYQHQCFIDIINKIQQSPEIYLNFDTVADVYQAKWIQALPPMCTWYVSGLDDGADEFYISIGFADEHFTFTPYPSS